MRTMEERCEEPRKGLTGLPFASIVPDRNPALKYHVGLGRAKSAVAWERPNRYNRETRMFEHQGVRGGEIYERRGDGWELLYRVEAGTLYENLPWQVNG
ncbi:hypothetical protein ACFC1D_04870 [Streptomyces vinaceus]|uniref:hypothetical protein n=1 Tax=Streptomyces vinaceus TaxID=1960 RepID=UPI0035D721D5